MTNISEAMAFEIDKLAKKCEEKFKIDQSLYSKYEVKRGLRDISGKGVLTGLTEISEIRSYMIVDSDMIPCEGKLYYQGVDEEELCDGFVKEGRFCY